jgi:hypothetical protein
MPTRKDLDIKKQSPIDDLISQPPRLVGKWGTIIIIFMFLSFIIIAKYSTYQTKTSAVIDYKMGENLTEAVKMKISSENFHLKLNENIIAQLNGRNIPAKIISIDNRNSKKSNLIEIKLVPTHITKLDGWIDLASASECLVISKEDFFTLLFNVKTD